MPLNEVQSRDVLNSEIVLGQKQVSILERCPYFRGVHSERFHCIDYCTVHVLYTMEYNSQHIPIGTPNL